MSAPGSGGEFGNPLRKFKLVFLGEQSGERGDRPTDRAAAGGVREDEEPSRAFRCGAGAGERPLRGVRSR